MNLKKLERYFRVNLLGRALVLYKKKRIYRAAVLQRLRNTALRCQCKHSLVLGVLGVPHDQGAWIVCPPEDSK